MAIEITLYDTGPFKRDIVEMAFEECGSAGYEFERTAEEVGSALRKLSAMMREWPWSTLGFAQPDYGVGVVSDRSGIPDDALSAVSLHLALRIAPMMGATLSSEMKGALSRSYSLVVSKAGAAIVPVTQLSRGTALGAGNGRHSTFTREGR